MEPRDVYDVHVYLYIYTIYNTYYAIRDSRRWTFRYTIRFLPLAVHTKWKPELTTVYTYGYTGCTGRIGRYYTRRNVMRYRNAFPHRSPHTHKSHRSHTSRYQKYWKTGLCDVAAAQTTSTTWCLLTLILLLTLIPGACSRGEDKGVIPPPMDPWI